MNNTCVSHLLIPESDRIQIVVSRVGSGGRTGGGTDITVTTMSRNNRVGRGVNNRKLPPLMLPEDSQRRMLSPSRIPSPNRRSSVTSLGRSNVSSGVSSVSVPASPTSAVTASRYHQGCYMPQSVSSPSAFPQLASANNYSSGIPRPQNSRSRPRSRARSPYLYERDSSNPSPVSPGYTNTIHAERETVSSDSELDPSRVEEYLQQNPDFLQNYISRYIEQETIESWIEDRQKTATRRKSSLSKWKYGSQADKRVLLQDLAFSLRNNSPEGCVLWELATCIQNAVSADSFTLYMVDNAAKTLKKATNNTVGSVEIEYNLEDGTTMAAYVAKRQQPQRLSRMEADARFPDSLGESSDGNEACYILCHPIMRIDGSLLGVLELHRLNAEVPFYIEDEEVVHSYLVWGGIALHYAEINTVMSKSKTLNEFLLTVVKSIFQDMVSMDTLIKKIMNFAQKLVDADRASLFLLDTKNQELYARLFDMGGSLELVNVGENSTMPAKEIRFPLGTGIAGQVAATGMVLNIKDAYSDDRFNRSVDKLTGYSTKTILCMPVFIRSTVIGVVQMVNKKNGTFTKDDEEAFQTFAVYCGLALHHAKLYDKIRRSEQKFKVALEVLSYHNVCSNSEFRKFKSEGYPHTIINLDDYYFAPMTIDDNQKVHYTIYMFVDLFGLSRFEVDALYKFFLTVKKNYRRVPYHNWTHGFTVGHSAYCILKKSIVFRPLECLAMYVSAVCHDLDHRGKNNKFMLDTASPLASIYTTSTLEHHHFNQTITILQQDGHNIFSKLSSEEYKQVLGNIKHCILATDLATFFPNRKKLQGMIDDEQFSWGASDHRLLVEAVAMTAADLCASTKPWEAQKETVKVIFEEFYEQGDLEKQAGRTPIPMMDRDKLDEQPASQVGFLSGICVPCYSTLSKLIPVTDPMLKGCQKNLDRWKDLAEQQKLRKEQEQNGINSIESDSGNTNEVPADKTESPENETK